MDFKGLVGPKGKALADGVSSELRLSRTGAGVITELHGRYFEQVRAGNMFSASNQAATAVSVALATAYTGILLYNPIGSGKVLVPNKVKFALSVAPVAIATLGLLAGFTTTATGVTQTTALTSQSAQVGNAARSVGIVLSSATIPTPTVLAPLWDGFTAGALGAATLPVDLEGVFGIVPGGFIGIYALTAVTGLGFMSWEEVDMVGGSL